MAIRDEKLNWKSDALNASRDVAIALRPILGRVLECGMSYEDFYYIVGDAAQMIIFEHDRHNRRNMEG